MTHKRTSTWDHAAAADEGLSSQPALRHPGTPSPPERLQRFLRRALPNHPHLRFPAAVLLALLFVLLCCLPLAGFILRDAGYPMLWQMINVPATAGFILFFLRGVLASILQTSTNAREFAALKGRRERLRPFRPLQPTGTPFTPPQFHERAARAEFWSRYLRGPLRWRLLFRLVLSNRALVAAWWIAMVTMVITTVLTTFLNYVNRQSATVEVLSDQLSVIPTLCAWGTVVALIPLSLIHAYRRRALLLASLLHDTCPDCRYELRPLLAAYPAGPARCPECGAPYPLIPAAVPDRHTPEALAKAHKSLWTRDLLRRPPST